MSASEEINAKLDWCVEALKYLLNQSANTVQPFGADEDAWLDEGRPVPPPQLFAQDPNEHIAVRSQPKPVVGEVCTHQHQVLVRGVVRCARCGHPLLASGVVGDPSRNSDTAMSAEWGRFSRQDAGMNGRFGED